jgi:CheY-like chemotaxis protein
MTTVLVVDDDRGMRDLLGEALTDEGYRVRTASDGDLVWDALAPHPAVIVLDVTLPRLDGIAVVRRLRADPTTRAIPIVLVSARRDVDGIAARLGVEAVIAKPFELATVLAIVTRLAEEAAGRDAA